MFRQWPQPAVLVACLVTISTAAAPAETPPDALDDALAVAGLTRSDLGWRARGWWQRYPQDIPYKLRHTDDLFAEPLAIVPFVRAMAANVTTELAPERLSAPRGGFAAGALYNAVHNLGPNKRNGSTRAYSANVIAESTPLDLALLATWRAEQRATNTVWGGMPSPYPDLADDLAAACRDIPPELSAALGKLVLDLLEARRWVQIAFRDVPLETRDRIASALLLGAKAWEELDYEPVIDDAARAWDEASLWYAGLKTVDAADTARVALRDILTRSAQDLSDLHLDVATPVGRVIMNGTGADEIVVGETGAFLIVDLGGDDTYRGAVGASHPALPLGLALDLGGDDRYLGGDRSLGAGVTGIGVLLDAEGSEQYATGFVGQGAGHFGMGTLIDLEGTDEYTLEFGGQGAGFFGIGVLLDLNGEDRYTTWGDGQGFGGPGGVGVLADRVGNDAYLAVSDPALTGRPSSHTEGRIAVSGAQGCGMGRRGDGVDGHSWAGGLGALLDAAGDDRYTAGNWAQGCGYWFGTGVVWDGGGNDEYRANGWASASGAHFCIGAVIDEGGDDLYHVTQNWGPAFGHDFTASILLDIAGNDRYECGGGGVGHSINRSVVLCLDGGGDDRYEFSADDAHPGRATFEPRFLDRRATSVYWTEATSVGLFLDVGGRDAYPAGFGDDMIHTDAADSDNARSRNRGIYVDRSEGMIDLDRPHGGHGR